MSINNIVLDIDDKTKAAVEDASSLHLLATSSIHINRPVYHKVDEKATDSHVPVIAKSSKGKSFDWKHYLNHGIARFK